MSYAVRRTALALTGTVLVSSLATAQVPRVPRRAQEAVTRAAGADTQARAQCQVVAFDSVTVELTPARLDQALKGLRASQAALAGQRGAPSWDAMVTQRDAAANAATALVEQKGNEIEAYREHRERIAACRDSAFSARRSAHREESMRRAMSQDPDAIRRSIELSQRLTEAQQRGDTATMRRIYEEMDALTKEDSLAVDRHCGRPPAPPRSVVQLDSLQALQDTLNARLRRREQEADSAALKASGLSGRQLWIARERMVIYLAKMSSESTLCGFTPNETAAMKARRAELEELL
jgi:hypothetical protein